LLEILADIKMKILEIAKNTENRLADLLL